jgi:putative ATP-dependent endonuclease of the OLD family
MYLAELHIKNFRRLRDAHFTFHDGLNVIVGENNSGKTALVDALRTVLNYRHFERDDLTNEDGVEAPGSSIEAIFDTSDTADQAAFVHALIAGKDRGEYRIRIAVSATLQNDELKRTPDLGYASASGSYYDVMTRQRIDYLQALRDPYGSEGLRAGRQSTFAHLLRRTTTEKQRKDLEVIAATASEQMQKTDAVDRATKLVNNNLDLMTGLAYAMKASLNFVEPDFNRLAAQLEGSSDGLSVGLMGLGSGNLVYISAVLGDMEHGNDTEKRYRAMVIEEPEAHLHPQRQILLLRFLEEQVETSAKKLQVFVTTHSPILASQAAMGNLLPLFDKTENVGGVDVRKTISRPVEVGKTSRDATRIRQYLDATRSELFFARRLILVEGDAERLLLPRLAKIWGRKDLEKRGVTVVSAAGLNFATFLPFIKSDVLNIRVAIITDSDATFSIDGNELKESAYVAKLRNMVNDDPNIQIFAAKKTFEYDLAIPDPNREAILAAACAVRPQKGPLFRKNTSETGEPFAKKFYREFFEESDTSKPEFAMELALGLESPGGFVVPGYIADAFGYIVPELAASAAEPADGV